MRKGHRFSDELSRVCVALMAFLGFSCGNDAPDMYGTPIGTWEIKGEVIDESNQPVNDATIKVTLPHIDSSKHTLETTRTNKDGSYDTKGDGITDALKVVCIPQSPDCEADSTVVNLKYSDGNSIVTVDFKLNKRED